MTNKKELSEEELENVNGGCDTHTKLPSDHGHVINKHDAGNHIGTDVYVVLKADIGEWSWGKLLESGEMNMNIGNFTIRYHKIKVEGCNPDRQNLQVNIGTEQIFSGDEYDLFFKLTNE